jgi:hypothetical protein
MYLDDAPPASPSMHRHDPLTQVMITVGLAETD